MEGLIEETHLFNECVATPVARQRMRAFMDAGGQTREVETRGFSAPGAKS